MANQLAISNIAWDPEHDELMHAFLAQNGVRRLEIAPSRIVPSLSSEGSPYEDEQLQQAQRFAQALRAQHHLTIVSMQSIWFGRTENIFGTDQERQTMIEYTNKALHFARATGCPNLVFGCPKNRVVPTATMSAAEAEKIAVEFFFQLAQLAATQGVVIAMEANPTIYQTNFINTTAEAVRLVRAVAHPHFQLNLDLGAMIYNQEVDLSGGGGGFDRPVNIFSKNIDLIHHVHLSEPHLAPVVASKIHRQLAVLLRDLGYAKSVSIEMKNPQNIALVQKTVSDFLEIFPAEITGP